MQSLVQQNTKLREIMKRCEEQMVKLKKIEHEHQEELEDLLKFNQRLLSIIQNQIPNRTMKRTSSGPTLQPIQQAGKKKQQQKGVINIPYQKSQKQQRNAIRQRVQHLQKQQVDHLKEQQSNYTHYNHNQSNQYNHYHHYNQYHQYERRSNSNTYIITNNNSDGFQQTKLDLKGIIQQQHQPVIYSNQNVNNKQQQDQSSRLYQHLRVINAESYSPSQDEEQNYQLVYHRKQQQQSMQYKPQQLQILQPQKQLQLLQDNNKSINLMNSSQQKDIYNQEENQSQTINIPKLFKPQKGLNQHYRKQLFQSIEYHLNNSNKQVRKLSTIKQQASQIIDKKSQMASSKLQVAQQQMRQFAQQQMRQQINSIRMLVNEYKEDFDTQQYSHLCNVIKDDLESDLREIRQLHKDRSKLYESKQKQCERLKLQICQFNPISHLIGIMRRLNVSEQTQRMVIDRVAGRKVNNSSSNVSIMDKCR